METQQIIICDETNIESFNNDVCSLCLCSIKKGDKILETMCNHYFHNKCFSDYVLFNYKKTKQEDACCPLCTLDATDSDYYDTINRENFMNNYSNIKIGEQVIAKTFGNIKFKVTGFKAIYLGKRIVYNNTIHYYKKFYTGTINGFIDVSLQRKDIKKVKRDKCIIKCYDCGLQSLIDDICIDQERLDKNYKEYYDINNRFTPMCLEDFDYFDEYENKKTQYYVINYESELNRHDRDYYSSFNIEYDKCQHCNSISTKICSSSSRI
jgi:hypothetical protein